jgi:hypothetical protein
MDKKIKVHIHRITFNSEEHTFTEDYVIDFLLNLYGSTNNLEFMYDEVLPIKIDDHRLQVDK